MAEHRAVERPRRRVAPRLQRVGAAEGEDLDALFEQLGLGAGPDGVLYADDGYGEAFFDDEHPDQDKSTVKLVVDEPGDVEEGLYERVDDEADL